MHRFLGPGDADGEEVPDGREGPLERLRFRRERETHRQHKLVLRFDGRSMQVCEEPLRTLEDPSRISFAQHWRDTLTSAAADDGYRHR